uniref:hypothetical protein n=1 Tax=Sphingomonas sp. H160509 TaxID=2955313 RepID=UPI003158938B
MERSFIAVTAIASTLMFAGVWKATEPQPIPAPAIVDTKAVPDMVIAAPPVVRRHAVAPARRVADAEPYNVVRPAFGSSPPARPFNQLPVGKLGILPRVPRSAGGGGPHRYIVASQAIVPAWTAMATG